ncbi:polysaccharide biosynthesis/export family protein [Amaricoccus solimangrovi]|uniref:polysaccharide biosynthesis/export family protein n=1 Tax=Amaricoccus solimangrovi TaxID=2589815 RepID=UPI0015E3CF12|nr:polysaccharide biosynthesis/export family protein [Amaricoccus solimangrovi]
MIREKAQGPRSRTVRAEQAGARGARAKLAAGLLLAGLAATGPGGARAADYPLRPGDVLEVAVLGAPEIARSVPVEADGTAWFPAIGAVEAAGSSLGALRQRVTEAYVGMVPAGSAPDGQPRFITANEVYVGVREYRPVYVSGDVVAATTVPFRPGLTARRALAQAGTGTARPRDTAGAAEQLRAAAVELGRVNARVWSLKRLLGTDQPGDYRAILVDDSPTLREIAESARAMVDARERERAREKTRLDEAIARAKGRIAALLAQKTSEEEGRALDDETVAEVRRLFERGSPLAPAARLAEVRRAALASASRVLEIDVALENTRSELAGLEAQAADLESGASSETWSALADALAEAQEKAARLAAARAPAGLVGDDYVVAILRDGAELGAEAGSDPELFPGDVIEARRIGGNGASAALGQ